ncbi:unnamed protein product [Pylaiella littoralis]
MTALACRSGEVHDSEENFVGDLPTYAFLIRPKGLRLRLSMHGVYVHDCLWAAMLFYLLCVYSSARARGWPLVRSTISFLFSDFVFDVYTLRHQKVVGHPSFYYQSTAATISALRVHWRLFFTDLCIPF